MFDPSYFRTELDNRRELARMIDRLDPRRRGDWLRWCAREASAGQAVGVRVIDDSGPAAEFYHLAFTLIGKGRLTLDRAGERLQLMLRGRA